MTSFWIGAGGLRPVGMDSRTLLVAANQKYYLGASNSPDMVVVTAVDKEWITYRSYPYRTDQRIETPIGRDLIGSGTKKRLESLQHYVQGLPPEQVPAHIADDIARFTNLLAGRPAPEVKVESFQPVEFSIIPIKKLRKGQKWDAWSEFEKLFPHCVSYSSHDGILWIAADRAFAEEVAKSIAKSKDFKFGEVKA